ncbi:hypothetical protein DH86_00003209 [Scytalidium sp. 3C]|nr:hypothetical protein DH86_00003209 [Scytalidium sp. 3C]
MRYIHCLYWFYSPEQFYTALDQTLEDRGSSSTFSWLCSLYSIFALGSMAPSNQPVDPNSNMPQDGKTAIDYLAMAKDLSLRVADEADIESVKAFALLSLANHAMCYSVASYLNIGTAVRIGLTLGLHRDVSIRAKETIERERGRRLWWTIYALDHEIAIRFGYPCAIVDHPTFMVTAPASEQVLDPGPNMPLGYQALLAELVRLRKKISFDCFLEPAHVAGRLPISRVTKSLSALKQWADSVPTYLSWDSSLPIQHRRSVSILHLRYWISIISVTRPFLLFSISRMGSVTVPAKRKWYQELSDTCIEAAERSVGIIKRMREDQTLSSLMLLDCHCIGEIIWILLLALRKLGKPEHQTMLRFCLDTMTSMEQIGCYLDYMDFNFEGSQFDVFETLNLDPRTEMMHMFSDGLL